MSLTDVAAKMAIGIGILVHDVESNCHVRETQRGIPRQRHQRAENVDRLSDNSRSVSDTGRRRDSRCQGVHGLGCPQQLKCLIVQQVEIRHINQHQSRLGVFVHPEVEARLVLDKNATLWHILDQTSPGLRIDREQEWSVTRQLPRFNSA